VPATATTAPGSSDWITEARRLHRRCPVDFGASALADGSDEGEGIGHLFWARDKDAQDIKRYTPAVILSAAEIDTLSALKARQASTLFPELRKAWMGEPLGFAYVAKEKRLAVPRHSYRLSLIVGIQPENAGRIPR
jgi:hypothetical protein